MVEIVRGQFNIHLLIYVCHRSSSGSREIKTQTGNYSGTIKQYIGQNIIPNMVKLSIHFAINIFLVSGIVSEYMSHGHVHCNDINCSIPHKNAFGFAAQIFASLVFNQRVITISKQNIVRHATTGSDVQELSFYFFKRSA